MERKNTGFKDTRGDDIFVGDDVWCEDELYEVTVNDFGGYYVIDSELGQERLEKIYHKCTKA